MSNVANCFMINFTDLIWLILQNLPKELQGIQILLDDQKRSTDLQQLRKYIVCSYILYSVMNKNICIQKHKKDV